MKPEPYDKIMDDKATEEYTEELRRDKMGYTKGDWEQDGNSIQVFQRGCICTAPKPTDGGVMERMDNLTLIAAAPRMYEALKAIIDKKALTYTDPIRGLIVAALAKVKEIANDN